MPRFISPPDPQLFNLQVWALVRQVPRGRVITYGQVAGGLPVPEGVDADTWRAFSARWVGGAMAACPADVPWQRVINAQGKISFPKNSPAAVRQRALLEAEGVNFDASGRVDLAVFHWTPPEPQNPPHDLSRS